MDLCEYYTNCELFLRPNNKFKYYKFQLENNQWVTINKKVSTIPQLRKLLLNYLPVNAYQSQAEFLSFNNIEEPNYQVADKCFMHSDLWIDLDAHDCGGLRNAQKHVRSILRASKFPLQRIVFSGGGFHIYYELPRSSILSPKERMLHFYNLKKRLLLELKQSFPIDVFYDTERITRLEGSWNSNKNNPCKVIWDVIRDAKKDPVTAINDFPASKHELAMKKIFRRQEMTGRTDNRNTLSCFLYITNRAKNGLYSPVLRGVSKQRLLQVQEQHSTGDIILLTSGIAVIPRVFDFNKTIKIMKAAKSRGIDDFKKRRVSMIRTSRLINDTCTRKKPEIKELLPALHVGMVNKSLLEWLGTLNYDNKNEKIGYDVPKVYLAEVITSDL